jgi:hypothetical protein
MTPKITTQSGWLDPNLGKREFSRTHRSDALYPGTTLQAAEKLVSEDREGRYGL